MPRSVRSTVLFLGLIPASIVACDKGPEYAVIQPFLTTPWAGSGQESLRIKVAKDGSGDLLIMSPIGQNLDRLRKTGAIPADYDPAKRPIYRYRVADQDLVEITRETWDENVGGVTLAICSEQRSLLDSGPFIHDLEHTILQFQGKPVVTAGQTVLTTSVSPDGKYTSCLSAEGRFGRGLMPFSDPVVPGKRFHQVFRMSDAAAVDKPVILRETTKKDDIRPCWSPDGRYVVYMDAWREHLWIVKVFAMPSVGEKK